VFAIFSRKIYGNVRVQKIEIQEREAYKRRISTESELEYTMFTLKNGVFRRLEISGLAAASKNATEIKDYKKRIT